MCILCGSVLQSVRHSVPCSVYAVHSTPLSVVLHGGFLRGGFLRALRGARLLAVGTGDTEEGFRSA